MQEHARVIDDHVRSAGSGAVARVLASARPGRPGLPAGTPSRERR